jgi:hypothetical protein
MFPKRPESVVSISVGRAKADLGLDKFSLFTFRKSLEKA